MLIGRYSSLIFLALAASFTDLCANKGIPGQQRNSEVALGAGGRVLVGWADDINGNGKGEIVLRGIEML